MSKKNSNNIKKSTVSSGNKFSDDSVINEMDVLPSTKSIKIPIKFNVDFDPLIGYVNSEVTLAMSPDSTGLFTIGNNVDKYTGISKEETKEAVESGMETPDDAVIYGMCNVMNNGDDIFFWTNGTRLAGAADKVGVLSGVNELLTHECLHLTRTILNKHILKKKGIVKWAESDWLSIGDQDDDIQEESFATALGLIAEQVTPKFIEMASEYIPELKNSTLPKAQEGLDFQSRLNQFLKPSTFSPNILGRSSGRSNVGYEYKAGPFTQSTMFASDRRLAPIDKFTFASDNPTNTQLSLNTGLNYKDKYGFKGAASYANTTAKNDPNAKFNLGYNRKGLTADYNYNYNKENPSQNLSAGYRGQGVTADFKMSKDKKTPYIYDTNVGYELDGVSGKFGFTGNKETPKYTFGVGYDKKGVTGEFTATKDQKKPFVYNANLGYNKDGFSTGLEFSGNKENPNYTYRVKYEPEKQGFTTDSNLEFTKGNIDATTGLGYKNKNINTGLTYKTSIDRESESQQNSLGANFGYRNKNFNTGVNYEKRFATEENPASNKIGVNVGYKNKSGIGVNAGVDYKTLSEAQKEMDKASPFEFRAGVTYTPQRKRQQTPTKKFTFSKEDVKKELIDIKDLPEFKKKIGGTVINESDVIAQGGLYIQPTAQDSINVYKSAVDFEKKMKDLNYNKFELNNLINGYDEYINNDEYNLANGKLKVKTPNKELKKVKLTGTAATKYGIDKKTEDIGKFYSNKKIDDYKYNVAELLSRYGYNTDLPYQLLDERIAPQGVSMYKLNTNNNSIGDVAVMLNYDPIAIKPYAMRTPAEQAEVEKKYGKFKTIVKPTFKDQQEADYPKSNSKAETIASSNYSKYLNLTPEDVLDKYSFDEYSKAFGLDPVTMRNQINKSIKWDKISNLGEFDTEKFLTRKLYDYIQDNPPKAQKGGNVIHESNVIRKAQTGDYVIIDGKEYNINSPEYRTLYNQGVITPLDSEGIPTNYSSEEVVVRPVDINQKFENDARQALIDIYNSPGYKRKLQNEINQSGYFFPKSTYNKTLKEREQRVSNTPIYWKNKQDDKLLNNAKGYMSPLHQKIVMNNDFFSNYNTINKNIDNHDYINDLKNSIAKDDINYGDADIVIKKPIGELIIEHSPFSTLIEELEHSSHHSKLKPAAYKNSIYSDSNVNITPYAKKILKENNISNWNYLNIPTEGIAKKRAAEVFLIKNNLLKPGEEVNDSHYDYLINNYNRLPDNVKHLLQITTGDKLNKSNKSKERFKNIMNKIAVNDINESQVLPIAQKGFKSSVIQPTLNQQRRYDGLSKADQDNILKKAERTKYQLTKPSGFMTNNPNWYKNSDLLDENIAEFFDPTGITSHDDAYRAYKEWNTSGNKLPNSNQALDMFGAVPALGKFGKLKYLSNYYDLTRGGNNIINLTKPIYKYLPWQKMLNFEDTIEDLSNDNIRPTKQRGGIIHESSVINAQKGFRLPTGEYVSEPAVVTAPKMSMYEQRVKAAGKDSDRYRNLGKNVATLFSNAAEVTGVPGALRFANDPKKNLSGALNTIDNFILSGSQSMPTGVIQQTPYKEEDTQAFFNTLDAAGLLTAGLSGAKQPIQKGLNKLNKVSNSKLLPNYKNIEQLRIAFNDVDLYDNFSDIYKNYNDYLQTKKEANSIFKKYKPEFEKKYGKGTKEEILIYGAHKELKDLPSTQSYLSDDKFSKDYGLINDLSNQEKFLTDTYQLEFSGLFNQTDNFNKPFSKDMSNLFEEIIKKNKINNIQQLKRTSSFDRPIKTKKPNSDNYEMIHYDDLNEGDIVYPEHMWSTTSDLNSDVWGSSNSKVARINIPKNQSILRPNTYKGSIFPKEEEVILPKNLGYKVLYSDKKGLGDDAPRFIFEVENSYRKGGIIHESDVVKAQDGKTVKIDNKEYKVNSPEYRKLYYDDSIASVDQEGVPTFYKDESIWDDYLEEQRKNKVANAVREGTGKFARGVMSGANYAGEVMGTPAALALEVLSGRRDFQSALPNIDRSNKMFGLPYSKENLPSNEELSPSSALGITNPYLSIPIDLAADYATGRILSNPKKYIKGIKPVPFDSPSHVYNTDINKPVQRYETYRWSEKNPETNWYDVYEKEFPIDLIPTRDPISDPYQKIKMKSILRKDEGFTWPITDYLRTKKILPKEQWDISDVLSDPNTGLLQDGNTRYWLNKRYNPSFGLGDNKYKIENRISNLRKNNFEDLKPLYSSDEPIKSQWINKKSGGVINESDVIKYKSGGNHGGLDRWFAEKWVDVKTGKECGRQEGEKRKSYPACRPSIRVTSKTPKTASELSSAEKEKFKRSKTSSQRINYQHKRNK